jgi:hypothetical protein
MHDFIDHPPTAALTAIDRGKTLPLTLSSLDPVNAERLATATKTLLDALPPDPASGDR